MVKADLLALVHPATVRTVRIDYDPPIADADDTRFGRGDSPISVESLTLAIVPKSHIAQLPIPNTLV